MENSSGVNHVIKTPHSTAAQEERFTVTRATLFFVHLHCGSFLASSGTAASPPHVELPLTGQSLESQWLDQTPALCRALQIIPNFPKE